MLLLQATYSPRRIVGLGRVDGEGLERFWSYLRHFSPITKQMTRAHRIDLLTDACIHFASRKIDALGLYVEITHCVVIYYLYLFNCASLIQIVGQTVNILNCLQIKDYCFTQATVFRKIHRPSFIYPQNVSQLHIVIAALLV